MKSWRVSQKERAGSFLDGKEKKEAGEERRILGDPAEKSRPSHKVGRRMDWLRAAHELRKKGKAALPK